MPLLNTRTIAASASSVEIKAAAKTAAVALQGVSTPGPGVNVVLWAWMAIEQPKGTANINAFLYFGEVGANLLAKSTQIVSTSLASRWEVGLWHTYTPEGEIANATFTLAVECEAAEAGKTGEVLLARLRATIGPS